MGAQASGRLSHCHRPTGACGSVVRGGGAGASCCQDVGCGSCCQDVGCGADGGALSCCHGVGCGDGCEEAPSLRTTLVFWDRTLTWMIPSGGGCGSFALTASSPQRTSKGMPGNATFPEPFDAFMARSMT